VKNKILVHKKFTDIDSHGIGLYLVYSHITNLGGKIAVESKSKMKVIKHQQELK
jgi:sensor histidine kinase regulating citrate/malate metabolism